MNILSQGLALQAASIGKKPEEYGYFKVECPNCRGFMVDSQGHPCRRCDRGFVEVKRKIVERKDQ